jgi:protein-tyrosine-phosphatase
MQQVVFVCTGNTCRSPMAAAFFNLQAQRRGLRWQAASAGIHVTREGTPAEAVHAALAHGADISQHAPQPLTQELMNSADVVLCMTETHVQQVKEQFGAMGKVQTLTGFVGAKGEIYDPLGKSVAQYENTAAQLWWLTGSLAERLGLERMAAAR